MPIDPKYTRYEVLYVFKTTDGAKSCNKTLGIWKDLHIGESLDDVLLNILCKFEKHTTTYVLKNLIEIEVIECTSDGYKQFSHTINAPQMYKEFVLKHNPNAKG